jgi:hypothetical protein
MPELRRSGRIAREVPIHVVGTDVSGKVFAEETKTVLLSHHGAGILSRYKIAPEEILTMRLPGDTHEAVIRLVGQMGERPDGYIYGVAFCDPTLDFWQQEFPAGSPGENSPPLERIPCECAICHERAFFRHTEIETDFFAVSDRILRFCKNCDQTTHWTLADPAAPPALVPAAPAPAAPPSMASSGPSASPSPSAGGVATATLEPPGSSMQLPEAGVAANSALQTRSGQQNRRRYIRTRVSFTACIRHPAAGEEIVECDNISKGGFCFRSRRQYLVQSIIEAAVPYSPGWAPIFVTGEIRHVEALPGNLFKYGVAYLKSSLHT